MNTNLVTRPVPPFNVVKFPAQSPHDRAAHALTCALDDLDAAIWQAKTRGELIHLRELANGAISRLEIAAATSLTLDERYDDMRGR